MRRTETRSLLHCHSTGFVPSGRSMATLIGTGWGGQEPYAFAWSATAGTIAEGADSATALL